MPLQVDRAGGGELVAKGDELRRGLVNCGVVSELQGIGKGGKEKETDEWVPCVRCLIQLSSVPQPDIKEDAPIPQN